VATIKVVDHHVIYENPIPGVRSRHAYFPGVVKLPSGDLLALFSIGEAMDATNNTTMVSRSTDDGHSWELQGALHERSPERKHHADFLKPLVLSDGTLIATGYSFHRDDPDSPVANSETDGIRDGDNLVAYSTDEGRTWTYPRVIPRSRPELIEASGSGVELRSGSILVAGSHFPMWDGTRPSGQIGVLLRSEDRGHTWNDESTFFRDSANRYAPSEPRLCELQDGRLVALFWTSSHGEGTNLPNHYTVSHDNGKTWSDMLDTGIWAQAPGIMHLGGDLLLTIHSHRERDVGLYVRIVDLANDCWRTLTEKNIWDKARASDVTAYAQMALSLKFGQPSLLRLDNNDVLATHWAVEDGLGRILTHRLRVDV